MKWLAPSMMPQKDTRSPGYDKACSALKALPLEDFWKKKQSENFLKLSKYFSSIGGSPVPSTNRLICSPNPSRSTVREEQVSALRSWVSSSSLSSGLMAATPSISAPDSYYLNVDPSGVHSSGALSPSSQRNIHCGPISASLSSGSIVKGSDLSDQLNPRCSSSTSSNGVLGKDVLPSFNQNLIVDCSEIAAVEGLPSHSVISSRSHSEDSFPSSGLCPSVSAGADFPLSVADSISSERGQLPLRVLSPSSSPRPLLFWSRSAPGFRESAAERFDSPQPWWLYLYRVLFFFKPFVLCL